MKTLFFIGLTFFQTALFQNVLFAQKKGQPLVDSLLGALPGLKEDTVKVKALGRIAETYLQINPGAGIGYAEKALAAAEKLEWKKGIARTDNVLGLLIGDTGNNTVARVYFEKSFTLNKELGNSFSMISNLSNIGRSYQRESDYSRALDYFLKALAIAEQIRSPEQMALVGTNITASFLTQENYGKAQEYAEMTLRNGELSHTPNNIGKALFHLGIIKLQTRDTAAAKDYFGRALKVYQDMDNQSAIAQVLVSMATTEYPDYRKAIGQMEKAQSILDQLAPSSLGSVANLANLGACYSDLAMHGSATDKKAMLDKGEAWLTRGMRLARDASNAEYQGLISHNLATIEEEKGNYKPALDHFKTFYSINDSLFSQDKKNELAGLEGKHQVDLKDKELAISNLKLASQRRTLVGLITGLVLLGVIGGLLLRQNRMRKRSNQVLRALNNRLDEANKVKLKFFGILSHDLRGPVGNLANYLYLLRNAPDLLPANERAAHQQQIGQSTEALLETLETMLLWSKEQMENFTPDIKTVPVSELFDHLQKFFARPGETQAGEYQAGQVAFRFQDPGALEVSTDENYLKVIMQNLTSNAIRALRGHADGLIEWKAWQEGGRIFFSIADNGPGIDPARARTLFEEGGGLNTATGFGFHLIRDLAKAIRIELSIPSTSAAGTRILLSC
jgi:signal transduction histidine kinase